MTSKIFRLSLLLLSLPVLPGCLTYTAIQAAKNPPPRVLDDDYAHAEKAVISKDDRLLIFLKGSITNSPSDSLFTLEIPMTEIETQAGIYQGSLWHRVSTNGTSAAILGVRRELIHGGWLPDWSSNDVEKIPLGPPISPLYAYPNSFMGKLPERASLLTNSIRSLYQVRQGGHLEFIYMDASYKRAYTDLQIDPYRDSRPRIEPGYYILLPATVPLDVATSPLQAAYVIMVIFMFPVGGC